MQNKTQNIVIGVAVAILAIAAIFYTKHKKADEVVIDTTNTEVTDTNPADTSATKTEVAPLKPKTNTDTPTASNLTAEQKAAFGAAIAQGDAVAIQKDYSSAITYYNAAIKYNSLSGIPYIRLYSIYNAQGDTEKAELFINTAIRLNPDFTDYWSTKLIFLDQKTNTSYADLRKIYEDGLTKVNPKTKVNLVIQFAGIAEANGQIAEAMSYWTYAKTLFPDNAAAFDSEIARLKAL